MLESLSLVTTHPKAPRNRLSAQRVTTMVTRVVLSVTSAAQVTSAMDWDTPKMTDLSAKLATIAHPTIPLSQRQLYQELLLSIE